MLINDKYNVYKLLQVTGLKFLTLFLIAAVVGFTAKSLGLQDFLFPTSLVAIFVAAVSIFLAFRINTGYSRWWLARQVWGGLINESRSLGMYITSMMRHSDDLSDDDRELHRKLIFRHIGFVNSLRLQLRRQGPEDWEEDIWGRKINGQPLFSDREAELLKTKDNKATQILILQSKDISSYFGNKEDFRQIKLVEILREFYVRQGQSEAIKNTVLAWGYSFYTRALVRMLAGIIILSQVNNFSIASMVLVSFIATVFITIEQVGRNLDNPFENSFNDTPLSTICRLIEIDLLQQIEQPCELKPLTPVNGRLN